MSLESLHHEDIKENTYIDLGADTDEGYAISKESRSIAREILGDDSYEDRIRQRCCIAVGDWELGPLLKFCHDPVSAGLAALNKGAGIFTDIRMVATGIQKKGHNSNIICVLDNITENFPPHLTRTSQGFQSEGKNLNDAILIIGNAPSALLSVCDLIEQGIRPALIIGTAVGYVNAAVSKEILRTKNIPSISTEGTRGGTPVAVAAMNEIITIHADLQKS